MAKILIVDDDPDMVLAARLCLEKAGHNVIEAGSGSEGLEKVKSEKPDLLILDVMMDTTTEGFQLALKLRSPDPRSEYADYTKIPIIMLTARAEEADRIIGKVQGANEYIVKPFDRNNLMEVAENFLKEEE